MSINKQPKEIFAEYSIGNSFKNSLGEKGLQEQSKINERFYVGDQWYGAKCGNERPLVRHNIIKRIGEYKTAMISANPIAVNFSAEGIPYIKNEDTKFEDSVAVFSNKNMGSLPDNDEINFIMETLSDYFNVTAERVKFDQIKELALRNAYISGTGIIYTYWDDKIPTGTYADDLKTQQIKGDIMCEVLNVENVTFGEPNLDDVQQQPYIIIAQRKSVEELKREAKANGRPYFDIDLIKSDYDYEGMSGQRSEREPQNNKRAVVLTKLWKEYGSDGACKTVKAIRVTKNAIIKSEWDIGLKNYPISKMSWERRMSSIYGDSEITYLIPNQIAINRALTAQVWSSIVMGMPILIKDADVISGNITNMPGQIIDVNCGGQGVGGALNYLTPPAFSGQLDNMIQSLIGNTLAQSGANDAALGDIRPDNMSAIIAVREAATMPLQTIKNRFYQLCEDTARIWADFWISKYGERKIKISKDNGTWYLPFSADRYKNFIISVKIDVGASTVWGEAQVISTLDNMLNSGIITPLQYFERLPKGLIPDITGLKRDLKRSLDEQNINVENIINGLSPQEREAFDGLDDNIKRELLEKAIGGARQ